MTYDGTTAAVAILALVGLALCAAAYLREREREVQARIKSTPARVRAALPSHKATARNIHGLGWEPACECGCLNDPWAQWHSTRSEAEADAARQLEKRRNAA